MGVLALCLIGLLSSGVAAPPMAPAVRRFQATYVATIEAVPAGLLSPLAFALVGCREAFRTTQEDEPWARDASVAASS